MNDLQKILVKTQEIVSKAADYIRKEVGEVKQGQIEEKELNSLVSYVDKNTEELLVKSLRELLPECGFITEEDTIDDIDKEYIWIIDPLDGTTNFLQQIPYFCVSVALQYQGEMILGVVEEVNRKEQFYAIKGKGAFMNGHKIGISLKEIPSEMIVATGFPYIKGDKTEALIATLSSILTQARGVRRLGAAALDLCYIAIGRLDAYYELNLNAWDVAAGALIVQEAGGMVTDFEGGKDFLFGGEILACAPQFYETMMTCLEPLRKAIR